jgi:HlyD family secretion protein
MKSRKNRIIGLVLALVVIAGGIFFFWRWQVGRAQSSQSSLQTEAAVRGSLTATVGATGVVRANQTAVLTWNTTGSVEEVLVSVGDEVESGTVLAQLEETSLPQNVILARTELVSAQRAMDDLQDNAFVLAQAEQALAQAEEAVRENQQMLERLQEPASQIEIDQAESQVELTRQQMETARDNYEPYQDRAPDNFTRVNLLNRYVEAQRAFDAAQEMYDNLVSGPNETTLRLAEANLELAQAQLVEARQRAQDARSGPQASEVETLENRIAAAEATLRLARLTAPFAGRVTEVLVRPGDVAAPGGRAFRVDDLSRLLVDVQVSEVDINRIQIAQAVMLTFDAIPGREYQGEVVQVALVGTSVQGVVDFTVTVELVEPDEAVRPGMTAAVNINIRQLNDVLLVPNRAVRLRDGVPQVYVLGDGQLELIRIELGASADLYSEVTGGDLREGDLVVLNPPTDFSSGGPPFMRR